MTSKLKLVLVTVLVALIAACGPIYSTNYKYIPPQSENGRMCIANCSSNNNTCEQMCNSNRTSCRMMNTTADLAAAAIDKGKTTTKRANTNANRSNCDYEYNICRDNCGDNYRSCYQNCGGQVIAERVCTAFCK